MSNEFVARNGIIALSNSVVSGSLAVTNGITGNITSASYALTASYAMNAAAGGGGVSNLIFTGSITASVNTGAQTFRLISGSSTFLYVSSSGNIGIGTATPTTKLHVSSSSAAAYLRGSGSAIFAIDGNAGRLFSVDDSLSGSLYSVNTVAGLPVMEIFSDNTVRIGQYGQKGLFVSQSFIGIGTEIPTAKVHITGSTGGLLEIDGVSTANNAFYVSSSGLVGIGTGTPTATLHITGSGPAVLEIDTAVNNTFYVSSSGQIGIGTGTPTATLYITGSGPAVFEIDTAVNNTFYVSSSGQIGIGTGTPSFTLDMSGSSARFTTNMQITGSLSVSGSFTRYVNFNRQTGNYTLTITDDGKFIEMNSASANIVTVPSSSVVNFPSGSQITIVQYGAGQTQISGSTTGVTIRSANNWLKINARYGAATLTKIGGNEWYLQGNLNA